MIRYTFQYSGSLGGEREGIWESPQAALVVVLILESGGGASQCLVYYCAAQFTHMSYILFLHHIIQSI